MLVPEIRKRFDGYYLAVARGSRKVAATCL